MLGGPTESDANEFVYSTWAIAHGHLACAYSPGTVLNLPGVSKPGPFIAPLYPLLSGAVAALLRIGHSIPFPSQSQLGPNCTSAYKEMFLWTVKGNIVVPTTQIAYLSWLALLVGVVALLRASGRGRRGWEPLTLILLACTAPIFECILDDLHPQDILAMGLILGGMACALRGRWVWVGILLGLAVTSQQFALLALVPLFVVAPSNRRLKFASATIATAAVVILPLGVLTSGRAFGAAVVGSGFTRSDGGTVLWELHLHGPLLFTFSRLVPVALSLALAWWALRKLGPAVLEPVLLISLIAASLCFRLIFEENLFGYYFMAVAVLLVVLDVVRGRIRGTTLAWIALATLAFNPVPWGFDSNGSSWGLTLRLILPVIFAAGALLLILLDAIRGRIRWYLIGWLVLVALTLVKMPWMHSYLRQSMPIWFWQIVLVSIAFELAVGPLISAIREHRLSPPTLDSVLTEP